MHEKEYKWFGVQENPDVLVCQSTETIIGNWPSLIYGASIAATAQLKSESDGIISGEGAWSVFKCSFLERFSEKVEVFLWTHPCLLLLLLGWQGSFLQINTSPTFTGVSHIWFL